MVPNIVGTPVPFSRCSFQRENGGVTNTFVMFVFIKDISERAYVPVRDPLRPCWFVFFHVRVSPCRASKRESLLLQAVAVGRQFCARAASTLELLPANPSIDQKINRSSDENINRANNQNISVNRSKYDRSMFQSINRSINQTKIGCVSIN